MEYNITEQEVQAIKEFLTPYGYECGYCIDEDKAAELGYDLHCGVSKGVLVPRDSSKNWVIKFDIEGEDWAHDYVGMEASLYAAAVGTPIEHLFCPIRELYHVCQYLNVYIAERCECHYKDVVNAIDRWSWDGTMDFTEYQKSEEAIAFHGYIGIRNWLGAIWGASNVRAVYQFLKDELARYYDGDFNCDIHGGNIGRTKDGRWILVDYCGYVVDEYADEP